MRFHWELVKVVMIKVSSLWGNVLGVVYKMWLKGLVVFDLNTKP